MTGALPQRVELRFLESNLVGRHAPAEADLEEAIAAVKAAAAASARASSRDAVLQRLPELRLQPDLPVHGHAGSSRGGRGLWASAGSGGYDLQPRRREAAKSSGFAVAEAHRYAWRSQRSCSPFKEPRRRPVWLNSLAVNAASVPRNAIGSAMIRRARATCSAPTGPTQEFCPADGISSQPGSSTAVVSGPPANRAPGPG